MAKVKLTQKYIDNPPPVPATKSKVEHCDIALPGLLWEQRATNNEWGSFRLRYKPNGKTSYVTVGRSCDITLQEAREKTKKLKAEIQLGADPQAAARERRKILTWNQYMDTIYVPHIMAHLRSWKGLVSLNKNYVEPVFGHLPLDKITLQAAHKLHRAMVDVHGLSPASADHLAKFLRQSMNYAVRLDLLTSSPVSKIQLFNVDNQEERFMSDEQLQRLMSTLEAVGDRRKVASLVIKFLLVTGARVNEALHGQWKDIDRKNRTWTVLATNSKSKRRRSIPLNDAAMAVLDRLSSEGKSEWLFTSCRGSGNQRLTEISKTFQQIRKDAGLPWLRIKDFRHNYASMLVNSGRTLYEVQQILGHSDSKVTERYAHLSTARLQEAANSAGAYLDKALEKKS